MLANITKCTQITVASSYVKQYTIVVVPMSSKDEWSLGGEMGGGCLASRLALGINIGQEPGSGQWKLLKVPAGVLPVLTRCP